MMREVARRLATAILLLCAAALAFSIVVALAYQGEFGLFGSWLTTPDFGLWVAGFEAIICLGGLGLIALLFARIEGSEDSLETDVLAIAQGPVRLADCPTCGADLSDIEFDLDTVLECPNCGEDLLDEIQLAAANPNGTSPGRIEGDPSNAASA